MAVALRLPLRAAVLLLPVGLCGAALRGASPAQPDFNCDGQPQGAYEPIEIGNALGTTRATFIRYGATLTHLVFSGGEHGPVDVVLGWDDPREYCASPQHTYFGATIGRVANRISHGSFKLDGKTYNTPLNEASDTLHGGWQGFDRHVFEVLEVNSSSVTFQTVSPDGEEGFPGNVTARVTHTITEADEWQISYVATTDRDTVVAMTNHAYFNLNGNVNNTPTVLEHVLKIPSGGRYVEVGSDLLPTGVVASVAEAPFMDFREAKSIGRDIDRGTATPQGGYDNAWVFGDSPSKVPLSERPVAVEVYTPLTGIGVRMKTDQPSVQIYSGNFLNGTDPSTRIPRKRSQSFGSEPQFYQWRGAFTLEAQQYPDSVNHPQFPSTLLRQGEVYTQRTSYQFFTDAPVSPATVTR